ncbi:hypothetical protein [Streptomyces sp. NPDC059063]|uniref:hypothetical protein n=1 Tax=unclassified Streptomyces TaxID=2593676 RepID=UPI0036AFC0DB
MSTPTGPAAAGAGLAQLALDFHHTHQLLDPAAQGVQTWQVCITAAGTPVGSLTAVRGLYWKSDNLRERMADEQSFPALVAAQLLDEDGRFTYEFEDFIESASSVLLVDRLHVEEAFADPVVVAGVVAAVIDRLTDNYFAVVLPAKNACTDAGSALLAEAGTLLSARAFSDELQIIAPHDSLPARDQLFRLRLAHPEIAVAWADSFLDLTLKTVPRRKDQDGFAVLAKRWRVERAISWIMRARRNVRDYERLISHSEAHITWTFITLMTLRLTRPPRAPRTTPHLVEPDKKAGKPAPIRLRMQPQAIRLAPTPLR